MFTAWVRDLQNIYSKQMADVRFILFLTWGDVLQRKTLGAQSRNPQVRVPVSGEKEDQKEKAETQKTSYLDISIARSQLCAESQLYPEAEVQAEDPT